MNEFAEPDVGNYVYLIYANIIESIWELIEGSSILNIEIDPDSEVNNNLQED